MSDREILASRRGWDGAKLARSVVNTQAERCLVGLFDAGTYLVAKPWTVNPDGSTEQSTSREMYDALFAAPLEGVLDYGGGLHHAVRVDEPLLNGVSLRAVLLRDESKGPFDPAASRTLRDALHSVDAPALLEVIGTAAGSVAAKRRHDVRWAMILADSELTVQLGWWSPQGRELFYTAQGKRLPPFIEYPLRRFVADWDWSDASKCQDGAFSPVPDVVVRVVPSQGPGAVFAMIVLEGLHLRVALEGAKREHRISPRETEVLQLLFEGYRVSEVAQALSVAESTVQDHIKRAISKTGSRNRVQMAARLLGWSLYDERRSER